MKGLLFISWALCALALAPSAWAQTSWRPQKNVEIIVGTSPGGGQDRSARAVHRLIESNHLIEVASTVVNKPGAGSALGYAYLNQHVGDPHYIMLSTTPLITNPITGLQRITYEDLTPLAMLFDEYIVASVAAGSPIKGGKELLARLKADPGSLTIGIPGVGGGGHLGFALAAKAAGIDPKRLKTVVFKSGGDSITALLGGHIDVMSSTTAAPVPQHRAGKVRIVAIGSPTRLPGDLASVPTWREQGANAQFANWRGMVGPRGLTVPQIAYWENVFAAVVETSEFKQDLERNHWSANFAKSAEMRKRLKEEHDELKALLTELGMAK
ncbi:MAG: tripartite tricarboxylate transporter substrate binding protein [Betaproteobacteria bacterium]|nr:tripartite tricarboxylate transporter substrate binding protein [Betaproteobacteria bacterium]